MTFDMLGMMYRLESNTRGCVHLNHAFKHVSEGQVRDRHVLLANLEKALWMKGNIVVT